jgi:hypothetical protein
MFASGPRGRVLSGTASRSGAPTVVDRQADAIADENLTGGRGAPTVVDRQAVTIADEKVTRE